MPRCQHGCHRFESDIVLQMIKLKAEWKCEIVWLEEDHYDSEMVENYQKKEEKI